MRFPFFQVPNLNQIALTIPVTIIEARIPNHTPLRPKSITKANISAKGMFKTNSLIIVSIKEGYPLPAPWKAVEIIIPKPIKA